MKKLITVQTLRSFAEIDAVRNAWTRWQNHANSDIDYYSMILKVRPEIQRPHVVAVFRDGVPDALLVGRIEQIVVNLIIGYLSLGGVRARRMTFIHGGFLGNTSPENSGLLVREILRSLKADDADMAVISHVSADCPLFESAKRMPSFFLQDHASQIQPHRSMDVPSSVEGFYQRLSSKVRKNLKWQAKKLMSDFPGQIRIHTFREPSSIENMFRDIEEIAKKTYQRGLGVGFADSPELRNRMQLAAERDWLRAHVLYISEKPCAFWVGTLYQGVFHSNFMGYERSYAKYSPGMFLVTKIIEGMCEHRNEEGVNKIDFGLGDAQYKQILADQQWPEGSVSIFAPSFAGVRLNLILTPPALVNKWAKSIMSRTGFLQSFKTGWRRRLAKN